MIAKTLICTTLFQLIASLHFGQPDYSAIDLYARSLHFRGEKDIIRITDSLTSRFETDLEKGRAVFTWITEHITYDCGSQNRLEAEPEEAVHPLYYTQQQLGLIIKTRRTRCDGYAFMFRLMCRLAGIYATTREGYALFAGGKVNPATVEPNHAWNAVCYDGVWYETDLTAASGHCEGRQFRRERREEFFLMDEKLIERLYIPIEDGRHSNNSGRVILKF
jgi:transglutaminase/protease-like cytokinesis protein 3